MSQAMEETAVARDHAWKYFELHANQRMSTFNFFLILSGLALAGLGACIAGGDTLRTPGMVLGLSLTVISAIFYKLDERVSFLVKRAERALAELEPSLPECAHLFKSEPAETAAAWRQRSIWTYGKSFRAVFWITALAGPVAVLAMLR
jgi:hypothetical protein